MRFALLLSAFFCLSAPAHAETPGQAGFRAVRTCVMQNDITFCRSILTADSLPFFDRFTSYKLMPCLPTDFTYTSEKNDADRLTVKATSPPVNGNIYTIRLVFRSTANGVKLDLPATFQRGFGQNWQDKVAMSEQIYLMMKQNMGDKLTCDQLGGLLVPH